MQSWAARKLFFLGILLHLDPSGSGRTEIGERKVESGEQLLTVLTRTRAGRYKSQKEESKTARAELEFPSVPKEPQRDE